jgi:serine protease
MTKRSTSMAAGLAAAAMALAAVLPVAAATSYPSDQLYGYQWALSGATASIDAPAAWCRSTGSGIVVADIDTGANFGHPDLAGKLIPGVAFLGGTSNSENSPTGSGQAAVTDKNGHGTITAGVIAADTNNGAGIAAVAPDARILVMKALSDDGSGYESDVALAMRWSVDHGANVINLSAGTDVTKKSAIPDLTIPTEAAYASAHNVAVVLAGGNQATTVNEYDPSIDNWALVTGALSPDGSRAPYSDYGTDINIYAPGGSTITPSQMTVQNSVLSTYLGSDYVISGGTSLSTPMVTGVVAQLMATGASSSSAMSAVTSNAVQRNGIPELDAAAALGVSPSQRCGTPATPKPGPPPPIVSGGGTTHTTTTTTFTVRSTTSTVRATTQSTTTTTTTTRSATTPGVETLQAPSTSTDTSGVRAPGVVDAAGGGIPAPLVIGGLLVLVVVGGPAGMKLLQARRRRGGGV